jgi:hypothetical protein
MQNYGAGQPFRTESQVKVSDTVSLGFERVLNTFIWNGDLGVGIAYSINTLNLHQTLRSKLIRSDPIATQGEYDGYIGYQRVMGGGWDVLARTSSLVVSDNQSIDLARLAQHQGFLGMGYSSNVWKLGLLGGYEVDAQESANDQGPAIDAWIGSSALHFQEIDAIVQADWTKSFLGKRSPEQQSAAMSLVRDFGGGDSDSLVVHYSSQRREFYTAADPTLATLYSIDRNIFRRDAVSYDVSNQLSYYMNQRTSIVVRGIVQNRTIDRSFLYKNLLQPSSITLDSKIQELVFGGTVSLSSRVFDWLRGEVGMSLQERDERFAVVNQEGVPSTVFQSQDESAKRLEYTSQRTSVWGSIFSDLSEADRLKIDGSASILRYDTPDSLNTDDRDELLLALSVEEIHNFNQYLSVGIEANVTLNHLVYLDRLQSANNNWNRVLSLSPRISLRPVRWIVSENVGEVVANYTVYDFEEQVASVKSFSFRQASWSDSTTIALNHRIDFGFSGTLRAYERGILKWKEFKEKPLDYFVEKSLWPRLLYRTKQDVALSVGYRYFSRDQYSYDGSSRTLTHSIVTAGPTVGVEWHGVGGTNVLLSGWRESSTVDSGQSTLVSNLSVSVSLVF